MFIKFNHKLEGIEKIFFSFDTHDGPVSVEYNRMDYEAINNDPQMSIELHAFMRCASILQSRCTITQTQGNA